jgi:hypothetical protein
MTGLQIPPSFFIETPNSGTGRLIEPNYYGGAQYWGFRTPTPFTYITLRNDSNDAWGVDRISYNLPSFELPVPEPSTWATMLLGFGLVGLAMRRQRKPDFAKV